MVAQHLLAVRTLDLLGSRAPAVFTQTENGVMILALYRVNACLHWSGVYTYPPVASFSGQHDGVLGLGDIIIAIILGLLDIVLGLDALILGECAVVTFLGSQYAVHSPKQGRKQLRTYTASMGQKVRADRLQGALGGLGYRTNGLEILFGIPAPRKGRERDIDNLGGSHFVEGSPDEQLSSYRVGEWKSKHFFFSLVFFCHLTAFTGQSATPRYLPLFPILLDRP